MKNYLSKLKIFSLSAFLLFSLSSQAGLYSGFKWGDPLQGTSGGEVTWSLMDSNISCAGPFEPAGCITSSLSSFMPTGYLEEIERAFQTWSGIADITFTMIADSGEAFGANSDADIRIAGHIFDGPSGELAHAYYPEGLNQSGDIHFDESENWGITTAGFFDIFSVALHEIGHAIGIGHSSVTSAVMHPTYNGIVTGLHEDDIVTVQSIYGAAPIQASVPEPSSILLFMSIVGLVMVKRKKI